MIQLGGVTIKRVNLNMKIVMEIQQRKMKEVEQQFQQEVANTQKQIIYMI